MRRVSVLSSLLALILLAPAHMGGAATGVPLEALRDDESSQGCGCEFSLRPQIDAAVPSVFALDLPSGDGLMRIGGVLLRLKKTDSRKTEKRKGKDTVGDSYDEVWRSGSTRVRFRYKTTFACPDNDSACEVTSYEGRMTIEHGGARTAFSIWGNCGC